MLRERLTEFSSSLPSALVNEEAIARLVIHFGLLNEWNQKINLVSRKSFDTVFEYHYADSLWISHHLADWRGKREVVDVGTGAGFPGLIYAALFPDVKVTLSERSLKKRNFLAACIEAMGLLNVKTVEELPNSALPALFIGRAVFQPTEFEEYFLKRTAPGSALVHCIGAQNPVAVFGSRYKLEQEITYSLPLGAGDRKVRLYRPVPRGTMTR